MEGRAVVKNVMNKTKGALLTDIIGSSRTKKGESERSEPTMTTEKRALKKAKLRHAEYYVNRQDTGKIQMVQTAECP